MIVSSIKCIYNNSKYLISKNEFWNPGCVLYNPVFIDNI